MEFSCFLDRCCGDFIFNRKTCLQIHYVDLQGKDSSSQIYMGSNWTRGIAENIRDELWSYFALSGLLFLNIGVVLMVYALKKATTHPIVLEVVGIMLIIFGVMATLTSWYVHRQHRRRKPLCALPLFCFRRARIVHGEDANGYPGPSDIPSYFPPMEDRYVKEDSDQKDSSAQDNALRMFSTLEFQMYEEYTKEDTVRRERSETRRDQRRKKEESQRKKKQVHPKKSKELAQANLYVNAMYGHTSRAKSPTTPAASSVWLTVPH